MIGGTRFIGRHAVEDLREHDYDVTTFTRGNDDYPFADADGVDHVTGDRTDREALAAAADEVDPDVVLDFVAYHPGEVETACDLFADVEAYVYVSSVSAYDDLHVPLREDATPIEPCDDEQATDDAPETYGARKAEGDRVVAAAADRGVAATSVRPALVYGPHDPTGRFDYWVSRVLNHDRVLVPGDGDALLHRSFVADVARAIRVVAEEGTPGEAYNAADRRALSLDDTVETIADVAGTDVEVVHAPPAAFEDTPLDPGDVPCYTPRPFLASTAKLADLSWESTPVEEAVERTVEWVESGAHESEDWPDREAELAVMNAVE